MKRPSDYCSLFIVLFPPLSPELQTPFLDIAIQGCFLKSGIKSNVPLSPELSRLLPHPRLARTFHLERQFLPPAFSQPNQFCFYRFNFPVTLFVAPNFDFSHGFGRLLKLIMIGGRKETTNRAMVGRRALIGGLIARAGLRRNVPDEALDYNFSPVQEQRLQRLKDRAKVPFDETSPDHQEALKELWRAAFPDVHLEGLISGQWKEMGWQGINPSTDFRGGGYIALENLLFFAKVFPEVLQATRAQLERDLSPEDVKRVRDLPAYHLLYQ